MPELPDIMLYQHALESRIVGRTLKRVFVRSPFVVRTYKPPIDNLEGHVVRTIRRLGKRLVFEFDADDLFLIIHLMIAGRFRWTELAAKPTGKVDLAAFQFDVGTLLLVEAGTKKRAAIHVVEGEDTLLAHDPGGIDVLTCSFEAFHAALTRENHTLKRTLTDPRTFDGIGNAYSDEILHAARLSPLKWSTKLSDDETRRLLEAARHTLTRWIETLRAEFADRFPGKPGDITAFRDDFAVHGKFDQPCPVCGAPVQRIVYAENETNYCPTCQTNGKVLADRSLSRLLKDDWPRMMERDV